jgi:hypothetical protein
MLGEFEIITDENGDETNWDMYDSCGNFYMGVDSETVQHSECLPSTNCCNLNVHDSFGDGMNSNRYALTVDGDVVAGGDGMSEHSRSHPFNCDSVDDGSCIPLVLDFYAEEIGHGNGVYMLDYNTGDMIWDAIGFEAFSAE